jgi:hypothetical protein
MNADLDEEGDSEDAIAVEVVVWIDDESEDIFYELEMADESFNDVIAGSFGVSQEIVAFLYTFWKRSISGSHETLRHGDRPTDMNDQSHIFRGVVRDDCQVELVGNPQVRLQYLIGSIN